MNESYSIKEYIEREFKDVKEHLSDFQKDVKEDLGDIKVQTTKTNGRVSSLENHRSYLWGAFSLLTILGATIIALAVQAIDYKIRDGISNALSEYEVNEVSQVGGVTNIKISK